jgi:hypothetical protein
MSIDPRRLVAAHRLIQQALERDKDIAFYGYSDIIPHMPGFANARVASDCSVDVEIKALHGYSQHSARSLARMDGAR